ncbi:hypothetical protein SFR_5125 [Streptomyces sp. FR-008]|nr:hypothetical protein SFR_5125 [Streptomyces sp. FR-008]
MRRGGALRGGRGGIRLAHDPQAPSVVSAHASGGAGPRGSARRPCPGTGAAAQ